MAVAAEFSFLRRLLERLLLPDGLVALEITADFGREDEEAAIDETTLPSRLFAKTGHAVALHFEHAEASRRGDRGGGGGPGRRGLERGPWPGVDARGARPTELGNRVALVAL